MSESPSNFRDKLHLFYDLKKEALNEEEQFPRIVHLREIEQRYEVRSLLGEGGMKKVFLVYDHASERELAMAQPSVEEDREQHENMLREAHVMSSLQHPNIMAIYDVGLLEGKCPFFVMEVKRDKNLKEKLEDHSLNQEELLHGFLKVCEGVGYAHSKGILHLDLKPENIQVGEHGEWTICDWGCADLQQQGASWVEDLKRSELPSAYVMGTPGYIAPERLEEILDLNPQFDVYALGVILVEMLLGRNLEKEESVQKALANSSLATLLKSICTKAIQESPEHRYQNVMDLKQDLYAHLQGHAPKTLEGHLGWATFLFMKRHAWMSALLMAFTLVLLLLSWAFIFNLEKSREETQEALDKVVEEQRVSNQLQEDLEERIMKESREFLHRGFYSQYRPIEIDLLMTQKRLQDLTTQNPVHHKAWNLRGMLYFIAQDFESTLKMYDHNPLEARSAYYDLAKAFHQRKAENRFLSFEDLAELSRARVFDSDRINYTFEKMILYDRENREEPDQKGVLLKALVKLLNPDWDESVFDYLHKIQTLRIGGKGLVRFIPPDKQGSRRNSLLIQKINRLILEPNDMKDLKELRGLQLTRLQIHKLDLDELDIADLPPLEPMISITVSPEQKETFPQLKGLPGVRLIVQ